jgi:outer membrane protein OmpA-like peptidoglycan-associated protein
MRNRFLWAALTLVAVLPTLALAQAATAQREGSWEFSLGAGVMDVDDGLADYLGSTGFADNGATPSRLIPTIVAGVGYNINHHLGLSFGAGGASGSGVKYVTPFADAIYTVNLNAKTSPFLTAGTQFTRITGNNSRVTHPTWGARVGLGVRHMMSENLALRLEGRMGFEHYAELPGGAATYTPVVTLGIAYFTAGRRAPVAVAPPPCPVCAAAAVRVDTVWRTAPAPAPVTIVLRDTLVLEGVNFEFDSSALTPESHWVLDRVAIELLKPQWVNTRWEIAGHTSSIGSDEYNMALSQHRAEAVRAYLVSRGVPNSRLTPKGYGETNPLYPNDSEGRNWRNRRVELRRIKP